MIRITPQADFAISPYIHMQFAEPLGNADSSIDAAWDSVNDRWQPSAIEIFRRLAPPMIRWGGCFASYYHWREAVGPRSERRPMLNVSWEGMFSNQVGTAEFMELCRLLGSEPLMCVNMESDGRKSWAHPRPGMNRFGTAQEAAEWVAYCNDPGHPLRRAHGSADPYNIRYWQIGNETSYGYHQVAPELKRVKDGYTLEQTIDATRRFAAAMRKEDPGLKLIAWGDDGWAPKLCEEAGDAFDLVAFHRHYPYPRNGANGPLFGTEYRKDFDKTWACLMETHKLLEDSISELREQVRPYGKRIAMTEGHYAIDGRNRGDLLASWAAGVAYARILNVIERNADILEIATSADFFGNRWQVNAVMLPTPSWSGTPYLMPVGEVMALFSRHMGKHAVPVSCSDPYADVTASMTGNRVFLHLANTGKDRSLALPLSVAGRGIERATAWEIAADPQAEITQATPGLFAPIERTIDPETYRLAPAAVAAVELTLAEAPPRQSGSVTAALRRPNR